jgi:hypothetical protein
MRFKQVRNSEITVAALGMLAILVLSAFSINLLLLPRILQKYEIDINRNVNGQTEVNVLAVAESINYTDATMLERFDGPSDPEDYLQPRPYLAYTFANYIDTQTLSYYQARYDSLQGKGSPGIKYTYNANVSEYQNFRIYNSPSPEGVAWHNTTVVLEGVTSNGSVVSKCGVLQVYVKNQTGYTLAAEWGYDYNFTDCYVVHMALEYDEFYAPTAAFFATANQIVVMDRDRTPLLIGVSAGGAVA